MTDQPKPPDIDVDIPIPGGLKVTTDGQPYHILLVGDFTGSEAAALSGPLNDGVVSVTADSLGELMQSARPSVSYKTTDPVASGNVMVEVSLEFDSLKAFEPKHLLGRIADTKTLAAVRERIVERMRGKLASEDLTQLVAQTVSSDPAFGWLETTLKWTPAKPQADTGSVGDLMSQLNLGDDSDKETSAPPKSPVGRLVSAAADDGTGIPSEEASALRRTLAEIDRRLSSWLTSVLHAPQVQSIEASWRSLAYLVSQIDFRKSVRLSVLHAPAGDLLERFRTMLVDPVFDEGANAPDLIVVDRSFGSSATDLEALDELAQHGVSLPAVVLAGVSPQFFGVKYAWQIATLPTILNVLDQWQFAKWKTLRSQPYARSIGVMVGRCLLREPYKRGDGTDLDFSYGEACTSDKDFIWANGPIATATTIARSVAETRWPMAMSGFVHGRVEGFKTALGGKKGDKTFGPSDTKLTQEKTEELGMAGINAVIGVGDHDDALVCNGLTCARAPRDDVNALLEVSLPYQLFACRLSVLLFTLKPHLSGLSPEKLASFVTQHVRDWLPFEGDPTTEQVSVQTQPSEDDPSKLELAVTVTPPQTMLPGGVPVVMGYRLG